MTTNSKYAYRASDELSGALRDLSTRVKQFYDEVITPWEEAHPDVDSTWHRRAGYELECLGFALHEGNTDVPPGLSANREREWLIPKRGRAGDQWRADLDMLNKRPRLGPILDKYGVEAVILRVDQGRYSHLGLHDTPDGYFLTWGCEHPPNPHLTPVPLSVYYSAVERATGNEVVTAYA
jgi:hypothetical protein